MLTKRQKRGYDIQPHVPFSAFKQTKLLLPDITQEDPKKLREDRLLKLGYMAMWLERAPFNEHIEDCSSPESAYFLWMEQEYSEVPRYLEYEEIVSELMEQDRPRIKAIWDLLQKQKTNFLSTVEAAKKHWETGKKLRADGDALSLTKNPPVKLKNEFNHAISLVITHVPQEQKTSDLGIWQLTEKSLRKTVSDEHKKYLLLLRLYYEMLLEKEGISSVLPQDHDLRQQIVERNAYARIIDANHRSSIAAKAGHHQQPVGTRLRRTAEIPYVYHTMSVTNMALLDVVPFVIEEITEEIREKINLVTLAAICQIHDLSEDTTLSPEEAIQGFLKRLANTDDSTIDPVIVSGFGKPRPEIKKQMLDLIDEDVEKELLQILRITSDNTQLNPEEQAIAEKQKVKERYKWDKGEGKKLVDFLTRLEAIPAANNSSQKIAQTAIIAKTEDRAHNLETGHSLDKLRATADVLIRYAMTEHDNKNYPLYNATARLIDLTLEKYRQLKESIPDKLYEADTALISELEQWQQQVKRHEHPKKTAQLLEEYHLLTA